MSNCKLQYYKILHGFVIFAVFLNCKGLSEQNQTNNSNSMQKDKTQLTEDNTSKEVIFSQKISGGILPFEREWIFYSNGDIRHPNGSITSVPKEQLEDISSGLQLNSELKNMDTIFSAPIGSADFQTLELFLPENNGIKKIKIEDSNDDVPDILWDFWDSLQDLTKKIDEKD